MRSKTLLVVLFSVGAAACGSRHNPPTISNNDPRCATVQTDIESVWNDEISLGLQARVTAAEGTEIGTAGGEGSWSRASLNRITTGMDQSSQDWARIRNQNCNDRENERMSLDTYEARMGCMDQWLANTRSAVTSGDESRFDTVMDSLNDCFVASRQP